MKLTKDECVNLHRELWDWLSKNPKKDKRDWPGWKNLRYIESHCFACDYCLYDCPNCLFIWPYDHCISVFEIDEDTDEELGKNIGIFALWDESEDSTERTKLAEQIRDLPIREDNDNTDKEG